MNFYTCNAVGIDVSKGKSTIAVMRPFGEVVVSPFETSHSSSDLKALTQLLRILDGDTRIIMEYTGKYYQPIARVLYDAGFYVSVIHSKLIHDFANNSIRKVKTDKADAIKIANYGLANWQNLKPYSTEDEIRLLLKTCNRQYNQYMKQYVAAKNNLLSILDQVFPGLDSLFHCNRRPNGHIKWIDVANRFWHCEYVSSFSENKFIETYNEWCKKNDYKSSDVKAKEMYHYAKECVATLPKNANTKHLVQNAVNYTQTISDMLVATHNEMIGLASQLPEYPVVMGLKGVGDILGPQLMAEIGDVRRFPKRSNLIAYAGIDAPPFQSGKFDAKSRRISKRGSGDLRKTLFQIVSVLLKLGMEEDPVYNFLCKKRAEGKPYCVYMMAASNKFLRIYYARVKEYLNSLEAN